MSSKTILQFIAVLCIGFYASPSFAVQLKVDPEAPAIEQYIAAVAILNSKISKKSAYTALAQSTIIARDAKDAGLFGQWALAASNYLHASGSKADELAQMGWILDLIYLEILQSDSSKTYVLATIVIDEAYLKGKTGPAPGAAISLSGGTSKPNPGKLLCSVKNFGGDLVGDPSPVATRRNRGESGPPRNPGRSGDPFSGSSSRHIFTGPNGLSHIDCLALSGGGVANPKPASEPAPAPAPTPPPEAKEKNEPNVTKTSTGVIIEKAGVWLGGGKGAEPKSGWSFVGAGGDNFAVGLMGGSSLRPTGFEVMGGIILVGKWMPDPNTDPMAGGICGDASVPFFSGCADDGDNLDACEKAKMKTCMVATCSEEFLNSPCSNKNFGPINDKQGQITDPNPEGLSPEESKQSCENPSIGKGQQQACCKMNPNSTGCSECSNPTGMQAPGSSGCGGGNPFMGGPDKTTEF